MALVTTLDFDDFSDCLLAEVRKQGRVAACFAVPAVEGGGELELFALVARDRNACVAVYRTRIGERLSLPDPELSADASFSKGRLPNSTGLCRKGIPGSSHSAFTTPGEPGHDAWGRPADQHPRIGEMEFYRVDGEGVHEVAVGPVHAGIIEPGHFRFQCYGEKVMHLEISLGYQHRDIERMLLNGPHPSTMAQMETIAGDTSIGHGLAHCQVLEALSGCEVPAQAQAIRALALELERLANHVGDIGALAGDVGFLPTFSYCGRLRGDYLNLSAALCGSRFGRGLVRPGGVLFDLGTIPGRRNAGPAQGYRGQHPGRPGALF